MGLPSTLPSTKLFWIVQVLKIGTCYDILKHLAQGVKVTYVRTLLQIFEDQLTLSQRGTVVLSCGSERKNDHGI